MPVDDRLRQQRRAALPGLVLVVLLGGCGAVVTQPQAPQDPAPVFLLDHGRHASLVLPRDQDLVRYAYGDWDWYAERRTGAGKAMKALFAPSQAALGRKLLAGPATANNVRQRVGVPITQVFEISVEAGRVRELIARLDGLFEEGREAATYNFAYELEFVPHPDPYSLGHNSNHVAVEWLRELGCTVKGDPALGSWRVRETAAHPP
jgi:hypothetical protein